MNIMYFNTDYTYPNYVMNLEIQSVIQLNHIHDYAIPTYCRCLL